MNTLHKNINKLLNKSSLSDLHKEFKTISSRYRQNKSAIGDNDLDLTDKATLAYVGARMIPIYEVLNTIFKDLFSVYDFSDKEINSIFTNILDLGSGPGTVLWSILNILDELNFSEVFSKLSYEGLDQSESFRNTGKRLARIGELHRLTNSTSWSSSKFPKISSGNESYGLVSLSFVLGEMESESDMLELVENAWRKTKDIFLIVEPGTPEGFKRLTLSRKHVISLGGKLAAPCFHSLKCPMRESFDLIENIDKVIPKNGVNNWCHFSKRVQRRKFQRIIKGGEASFEDERFCYAIFSSKEFKKNNSKIDVNSRIIAEPKKLKYGIEFQTCTNEGLIEIKLKRKKSEDFEEVKKIKWGGGLIS